MKPRHAISTIALAASIAVSVGPTIPADPDRDSVRARIESLRQALDQNGAVVHARAGSQEIAQFGDSFQNTHNNSGCSARNTC